MSKFQIILIGLFVIFIGIGVFAFATFKGSSEENTLPPVTIWGTLPSTMINETVTQLNLTRDIPIRVNYVEIPVVNFRTEFIEELAKGKGPDAILIPQQDILGYSDKIITIPNTSITQRDFQNTFTSQANLYLTTDGVLALPLISDPLVMYWNRTIFTNAGIAKHPSYWDEFTTLGKKMTIKDSNSNIKQSTIAFGEFSNVNNAREILSALFFQVGNPVTAYNTGGIESTIADSDYSGSHSANPALNFFTQFADPRSTQYSWNRSLLSSKNSFISGNLATYFGFASEMADIRAKNPNLNFDVSSLPQARNSSQRTTYGNLYGLSIVRSSLNVKNTFNVLQILTSPQAISILSNVAYLPSARRDIIAQGSIDPYISIFLDSSLISQGWLDTSPNRSYQIFKDMVESITSGRSDINNALKEAHDQLNVSLRSL
jgi:ABC-type glycerol-3-phosphate transport system substrate-binding protein